MKNETEEEKEEDMTLSQEILVLDFGDEKQSEYLKSEANSAEFGKGKALYFAGKNSVCYVILI